MHTDFYVHPLVHLCMLCICVGLVLFTHMCYSCLHLTYGVSVSLSVGKSLSSCRHSVCYLQGFCYTSVFHAMFQGCKFMLVYACITCNFCHTHANVKNSKMFTCKLLVGLYFYVHDRYCVTRTATSVLALWGSDCSYISSTQSFIQSQNHLHIHILMKTVERDRKAFNHWATCHVTTHLTLIAPCTWML